MKGEEYGVERDATEVEAAERRLVEAVEGLGQALDKLEHRLEHVLRYPTPQIFSGTVEEMPIVSLKLPESTGAPLTDFLSAQVSAVNAHTGRVGELVGRLAI